MFRGLLVSYRTERGWQLGARYQSRFTPLSVAPVNGWSAMRALLMQGETALAAALDEAASILVDDSAGVPATAIRMGPTIPDPEKILCVGFNYDEHSREMAVTRPVAPDVFAKFRNGLVCDGDQVPLPGRSTQVDYEGELAAIMGHRCRAVTPAQALEYVAGYTIVNDITARDLQFRTSQWTLGKALDRFCPMGPGLAARALIPDPQDLRIMTRINGQLAQDGHTSNMVFSVAALVAHLSASITLEPGDVISTGTPAGVGYKSKPPRFLQADDTVEVEIPPIGTLTNRITTPLRNHSLD